MKKSFIAIVGLIFISYAFHSCSNDYSDNVSNALNAIVLKSDSESNVIGIDQILTFSVTGSDGIDYTDASTIYVNGTALDGDTHQFDMIGEYQYYAVYSGFTSNVLTFNVVNDNYVTVSHELAFKNQTVTFNFYNISGEDITAEADFFVNNLLIDGHTFSTDVEGDYEVYAQRNGIDSDSQLFKVFYPKKKVALDDYTGTWCGWCPRILNVVNMIQQETDNVVVLAIHAAGNDPMEFPQYQQIFDYYGVNPALPRLFMDKTDNISVLNDTHVTPAVDAFLSEAGIEVPTSIAINTSLSGDNLNVSVSLLSEQNLPDTYKIIAYLYQDGLIYDQTNYYNTVEGSPWHGMGNPIPDFVHNHVLEANISNLFGNNISATSAYNPFTMNFNAINLSNYAHTDNGNTYNPLRFGVVVYLVDENNRAINSQHVQAGQSAGYE